MDRLRRCHLFLLNVAITLVPSAGAATPSPAAIDLQQLFAHHEARALAHSPSLLTARALLSQRKAQVFSAAARWLPRLDLALSQSKSQDFGILQSGALGSFASLNFTPQEVALSRWTLSGRVPLYSRSVHLNLQIALAERRLAEAQLENLEQEVTLQLRQLYGAWILSEFRVVSLQTSLRLAERNLKEARLRFEQGQRTRIDVLKAEANAASLQSQKLLREQERHAARDAFLQAVSSDRERTGLQSGPASSETSGLSSFNEAEFLNAIARFSEQPELRKSVSPWIEASPEQRLTQLLAKASALAVTQSQAASREAQARQLWQDFFPEVALQAQLYKQGTDWDQALQPSNRSYSVGVTVTVPIFSFGSSISGWFEKQAAQEQARLSFDQSQARLRDDLESLRLRILQTEKALEAQRTLAAQQEEILRLSFKSYQLGRTTMTELLAAEGDRNEGRLQLARLLLESDQQIRQFSIALGLPLPHSAPSLVPVSEKSR
jgi:outer membrane protein TolC